MPLVSITRLRVRSWRYLPIFAVYAFKSSRQAAKAPGNLAIVLYRDQHNTYWTGTVWTDEASMKAFMLSGAHRQAMPKLLEWCDEAALVHWTQDDATLPSWPEACRRLQNEGRKSKVNHPSPIHTTHQFPTPRVPTRTEVRFK